VQGTDDGETLVRQLDQHLKRSLILVLWYHPLMTNEANESGERQVAKTGFGAVLVNHLRSVDHASTDELAKIAGVRPEQAYARLMYLQSHSGIVRSSGRGTAKLWSMADKEAPPMPKAAVESRSESITGGFNRSHGWKPSLDSYKILDGVGASRKDKLLVEYPENWRHTALVEVLRDPGNDGVAMCWDLRNKMFTYVPVTPESMVKHSVKVAKIVSEKDLVKLENE